MGWCELLGYLAWAPEVGTLMDVLEAASAEVRPELIPTLLSISRGTDRGGRMLPADGEVLRARMLTTAENAAERGCLAMLYADAGERRRPKTSRQLSSGAGEPSLRAVRIRKSWIA